MPESSLDSDQVDRRAENSKASVDTRRAASALLLALRCQTHGEPGLGAW
jgi:hypothetical protein